MAKLVLGVLFFTQGALGFAACDLGLGAPALAISAMRDMPCCAEDEAPDGMSGNANLCLVHCTSDAQRVDSAGLIFPAFSSAPVLVVAPAPTPGYVAVRRLPPVGGGYADPPRTILFQNFRI